MIDPSALSWAATALRDHLATHIRSPKPSISIGDPASTLDLTKLAAGQSLLNLFFYRIEYAGYPANAGSEDQQYVSLFCLLTPATTTESKDGGETVSAGELDLRLLGQVMRTLQVKPHLRVAVNGTTVSDLEIVPHSLSLDDLNKIWATQPGVAYRPSVAYELALMPVPEEVSKTEQEPRLVGFAYVEVKPTLEDRPPDKNWLPHLWLLDEDDQQVLVNELDPGVSQARLRLMASGPTGLPEQQRTLDIVASFWTKETGWKHLKRDESLELKDSDMEENGKLSEGELMLEIPVDEPGQLLIQVKRRDTGDAAHLSNAVLVIVPDGDPR